MDDINIGDVFVDKDRDRKFEILNIKNHPINGYYCEIAIYPDMKITTVGKNYIKNYCTRLAIYADEVYYDNKLDANFKIVDVIKKEYNILSYMIEYTKGYSGSRVISKEYFDLNCVKVLKTPQITQKTTSENQNLLSKVFYDKLIGKSFRIINIVKNSNSRLEFSYDIEYSDGSLRLISEDYLKNCDEMDPQNKIPKYFENIVNTYAVEFSDMMDREATKMEAQIKQTKKYVISRTKLTNIIYNLPPTTTRIDIINAILNEDLIEEENNAN